VPAACRLTTLGALGLTVDGVRVPRPATQKARAIVAYLVLHRRAGVARERLLELFWPDVDPARSRASLSTALNSIRRCFRSAGLDSSAFLVADKRVVRWTAETEVDLEELPQFVEELELLLAGAEISADSTIFVLTFFHARSGELRCRLSDPRTADRWIIDDGAEVKRALKRLQALARQV